MTLAGLIICYTAFAIIAIALNPVAQRLVLAFYRSTLGFGVALILGTAIGLVAKYTLDKRRIFFDVSTGFNSHSRKLSLNTAMGLVTRLIFWGTETTFWLIFKTNLMRETGAVLGLTVCYFIKFHLDRHYVFADAPVVGRVSL